MLAQEPNVTVEYCKEVGLGIPFIPNFNELATSIEYLLGLSEFSWTRECTFAFNGLV